MAPRPVGLALCAKLQKLSRAPGQCLLCQTLGVTLIQACLVRADTHAKPSAVQSRRRVAGMRADRGGSDERGAGRRAGGTECGWVVMHGVPRPRCSAESMPRLRGADTLREPTRCGWEARVAGRRDEYRAVHAGWPDARDRTGQTPFRSGRGRIWSRGSADAAWWPGGMGGGARVGFCKRAGCIRLSVAGWSGRRPSGTPVRVSYPYARMGVSAILK